jgi:hypothetical protein
MRVLLLILLASACTLAEAAPARKSCGKFSSSYSVSPPMTIEEIEKHEMEKTTAMLKMREDLPKVPFAFMHGEWLSFKSRLRPGDEIVAFISSEHSWQHLAGEMGYAMMRAGCVIETFVTMRN